MASLSAGADLMRLVAGWRFIVTFIVDRIVDDSRPVRGVSIHHISTRIPRMKQRF